MTICALFPVSNRTMSSVLVRMLSGFIDLIQKNKLGVAKSRTIEIIHASKLRLQLRYYS